MVLLLYLLVVAKVDALTTLHNNFTSLGRKFGFKKTAKEIVRMTVISKFKVFKKDKIDRNKVAFFG